MAYESNRPSSTTIHIAAALLYGPDGRTLLVRKRGTSAFIQPGGKIENGEDPVAALVRELREELGVDITQDEPVYLGSFRAPAANEPGSIVQAEIFRVVVTESVTPAAEIDEILWIDPLIKVDATLAPLTCDHVLKLHLS